MKLAVTGYRDLPPETRRLVDDEIRGELRTQQDAHLIGISCLADETDSLFARAVLDAGGELEVIMPPGKDRDETRPATHDASHDELLARASRVDRLDRIGPNEDPYFACAAVMLARADALLAVWDGESADDDCEEVMRLARRLGRPVTTIWPAGAVRT